MKTYHLNTDFSTDFIGIDKQTYLDNNFSESDFIECDHGTVRANLVFIGQSEFHNVKTDILKSIKNGDYKIGYCCKKELRKKLSKNNGSWGVNILFVLDEKTGEIYEPDDKEIETLLS